MLSLTSSFRALLDPFPEGKKHPQTKRKEKQRKKKEGKTLIKLEPMEQREFLKAVWKSIRVLLSSILRPLSTVYISILMSSNVSASYVLFTTAPQLDRNQSFDGQTQLLLHQSIGLTGHDGYSRLPSSIMSPTSPNYNLSFNVSVESPPV